MNKRLNRKKRGQTTEKDDGLFNKLSEIKLIKLLLDKDPQKRTSAAKLLGKRRSIYAIVPLCSQLKQEKALYSKIAISEALGEIGKNICKTRICIRDDKAPVCPLLD